MKKATILVILLTTSIIVFSQTQSRIIDEINYEQGLHSLAIRAIFQDHKGFIWISSSWMANYSLHRYDGYRFINYNLNMQPIFNIVEDMRGLLWLSSDNGFYVMNPETEKFTHYVPSHTYSNITVNEILEDKNGILWCASSDGLYKMTPKVKNGKELKDLILKQGIESAFNITVFRLNKSDTTINANIIRDIYEDSRQRIWVGGYPGLFIYNDTLNEFIRVDDDANGKSRLSNAMIHGIVEENPDVFWVHNSEGFTRISNVSSLFKEPFIDKTCLNFKNYSPEFRISTYLHTFLMGNQHKFWFGTPYNGLIKLNIDNKNEAVFEEIYPEIDEPKGNLFESVTCIMKDRTNILWVGHESGRIKKIREVSSLFTPLEELLRNNPPLKYHFNKFLEDNEGNLWVCSWGSGIYKINPEWKVSNYQIMDPAVQNLTGNYAISLLEIEKNIIWIGAASGVWQLNTNTGKSQRLFTQSINNFIYGFLKIEDFIIIDGYNQGFFVYNMKTDRLDHYTADQKNSLGLKSNWITSFDAMKNGEIWISTGNQGLTRLSLNTASGAVNFLPLPESINTNRQTIMEDSKWINKIFEDEKGNLWFGTGKGLINLDIESGWIQRWTQEDGLCSNNIESIEEDKKGNLWLAGADGVSMMEPSTDLIKTFNEHDGLPKVRNMHSISYKNKNGLIYFGGLGGFYSINPDAVQKNDVIPSVVITDFRLFDKSIVVDSTRRAVLTKNISYTQEIILKYNLRMIYHLLFQPWTIMIPSKTGTLIYWKGTGIDGLKQVLITVLPPLPI